MQAKPLILWSAGAVISLGLYSFFEFNRAEITNAGGYLQDHYLTDRAKILARQRAAHDEMSPSMIWLPFYGERAKAERAKIHEETKVLGDLELVRYVHRDSLLRLEMSPSRSDSFRHFDDIDKRVTELDAKIQNATSSADREANLKIKEAIRERMKSWGEKYRETIALYREGDPERFSVIAFRRSAGGSGSHYPTEGEAFFSWRAEGGGFHRFLCWTTHDVRRFALLRPWIEVSGSRYWDGWGQGDLIGSNDSEFASRYRYLVSPTGWIGRDGTRHEWFYEFEVDRRDPLIAKGAKPGYVTSARSGLSGAPRERYTTFLARGVYPPNSVLDRALRLEAIQEAAKEFPILLRLEVSYDIIHDQTAGSERFRYGFFIVVDLGKSSRPDTLGKRLIFTVPSGLGGACDANGRPLAPNYLPRDLLGAFQRLGENVD
jgi:hypothetical protein